MRALLLPQPLRHVGGEVGDDHVGSGAADAGEHFHDDAALVDPAVLGGGFDHGVFAADVVGGDGQVAVVAHATDDIQIGQAGLTMTISAPSAMSRSTSRRASRTLAGSIW